MVARPTYARWDQLEHVSRDEISAVDEALVFVLTPHAPTVRPAEARIPWHAAAATP